MDKLKKALENKVGLEDARLASIDEKIADLKAERTFHVGLRTAFMSSLAELEKAMEVSDETLQ